MKDKSNYKSYEDVRSKLAITLDELLSDASCPRPVLTEDAIERYSKNTVKVISENRHYCEDVPERLIDITSYYNFLGHKKFLNIIKNGYSENGVPKPGDLVVYRTSGRHHIGFVNMTRETIDKNFTRKEESYITIAVSYIGENGSPYTEAYINKVFKKNAFTRLSSDGLTFGRPFESCLNDFLTERKLAEDEYKRRAKKKVMTVGEYEDMMEMFKTMTETIKAINDKIPYKRTLAPG